MKEWKKKGSIFSKKGSLQAFIETHSQEDEWVDDAGIIVQAAALIIGRPIQIVGSIDYSRQNRPYTLIDSIPGTETYPPLTVAYIQGYHYQSLRPIGTPAPNPIAASSSVPSLNPTSPAPSLTQASSSGTISSSVSSTFPVGSSSTRTRSQHQSILSKDRVDKEVELPMKGT